MSASVRPTGKTIIGFIAGLLCYLATAVATAQETAGDPPGRVARLSYMQGDVALAPAGTEEWADAVLNRPLTSGDRLSLEKDARAELQIGSATVHLDQDTGFGFLELDDDVAQMSLTSGAATIRVRRRGEHETIQIETPNATVSLLHPGEYHIEVDTASDRTIVKTRHGEAQVGGGGRTYAVRANEQGVFSGLEELQADISTLGARTAFESWANERDARDERSASARYVAEDVIGYEDLDDQGEWIEEPEYGRVWRPIYVASDWAPYRFGRWVWVSPWGWTWVDDARWGFAPFHYGRWAYLRSRWCWVPGPRHIRAVYAPALVAWVGGPRVSVSVSFGSGIGWFPLGPREVYVPGYRYSPRYIRRVNVSNTVIVNHTSITNVYAGRHNNFDYVHRHHPGAVTVARHEQFIGGRSIGEHRVRVDEGQLRNWRNDSRPPAIAPNRDSVFASRVRTDTRATRNNNTGLVARHDSSNRNRVSFDAERNAIAANGGRPVGTSQLFNNRARNSDRGARPTPAPEASGSNVQPDRSNQSDRSSRSDRSGESDRSSRWAVRQPPRQDPQAPALNESQSRGSAWRSRSDERARAASENRSAERARTSSENGNAARAGTDSANRNRDDRSGFTPTPRAQQHDSSGQRDRARENYVQPSRESPSRESNRQPSSRGFVAPQPEHQHAAPSGGERSSQHERSQSHDRSSGGGARSHGERR
jgi:hypothetical protein